MCISFGDICFAYMNSKAEETQTHSSVQSGLRPVLIAQNDIGNKYSTTVTVIPFTGKKKASYMPTHIAVDDFIECGLTYKSVLMVEQIQTISKNNVISHIGRLPEKYYPEIAKAINIQCPFI